MVRNWRNKILDLVGFSNAKSRVLMFSLIFLFLLIIPTRTLENLPDLSLFHLLFQRDWYSTGITRGMSRLLHGDIQGAYNFNPLVFPSFLVMISILIKDIIYLIDIKKLK